MKQFLILSLAIIGPVVGLGALCSGCVPPPTAEKYRGKAFQGLAEIPYSGSSEALGIGPNGIVCGIRVTGCCKRAVFIWDQSHGLRDVGMVGMETLKLYGVSDSGLVAGTLEREDGERSAYVWDEVHGRRALGRLGDETSCWLLGVTRNGVVAGYPWNGTHAKRLFLWDEQGGLREIEGLEGEYIDSLGMNSSGYVAGLFCDSGDWTFFVWHETTGLYCATFPAFRASNPRVRSVDSTGRVLVSNTGSRECRSVVWDPNRGLVEVGAWDGWHMFPVGMSEAGHVTGYAVSIYGDYRAFIWDETRGLQDIGSIDGGETRGYRVNANGVVVGLSEVSSEVTHPFLWNEGKGIQDLVSDEIANYDTPFLNDRGDVAVNCPDEEGRSLAYIWDDSNGLRTIGGLGCDYSEISAMGNDGLLAGWSVTPEGAKHAFVWDAEEGMRDITAFRVSSVALVEDMNDLGQAVGTSEGEDGFNQGSVWLSRSESVALEKPYYWRIRMYGINNKGQAVGYMADDRGTYHGIVWDEAEGQRTMDTSFMSSSCFRDINDAGQIVGYGRDRPSGFIWKEKGEIHWLEPDSEYRSVPYAINERGQVAGYRVVSTRQAFVWDPLRGMQDLASPDCTKSEAHDINDLGQVVGGAWFDTNSEEHAFLWTRRDGMVDLGTLGGDLSVAYGINNRGVVVGTSWTSDFREHAFVWDKDNGMRDLNDLVDTEYHWFHVAHSINERGQIAVTTAGQWGELSWEIPEYSFVLNPDYHRWGL